MPLRNRVTPTGELIATPERGLVYGNRGCLHDADGAIVRPYAVRRWISCRLEFQGWRRHPLRQPGRFTELFFLDEATALAAGHRPCALCRRADHVAFAAAWREEHPADVGVDAIDRRLHAERLDPATRRARVHALPFATLPTGAMVLLDDAPHLVEDGALRAWSPGGYGEPRAVPGGTATVLTPPTLVKLLRRGWTSVLPLVAPGHVS